MTPVAICRMLEMQAVCRAFSRAWAKTGKRIAARIAIIAMTTSNSIKVKPRCGARTLRGFVRYLTVVPPHGFGSVAFRPHRLLQKIENAITYRRERSNPESPVPAPTDGP